MATDSFKGSLTAAQAAASLARGIGRQRRGVEVREHPVADGGEGTVAVARRAGFTAVSRAVTGPLGSPVLATYALRGTAAVVESASCAGLGLVGDPSEQTAALATTAGVGELIKDAIDRGATNVLLGLGGSASTDGGAGAIAALGGRILAADGARVGPGGAALLAARQLDLVGLDRRLRDVDLVLACDVDNPLTGPSGAAAVYGPQKGASPALIATLDAALTRWAHLVAATVGTDRRHAPGAGAAGGLGFGAAAVLGGRFVGGVEAILQLSGFATEVGPGTLVVVGEGTLDEQSLHGKTPIGVAHAAGACGALVVAVCGRCLLTPDQLRRAGIDRAYVLAELEPDSARSMTRAAHLLERIGAQLARDWLESG